MVPRQEQPPPPSGLVPRPPDDMSLLRQGGLQPHPAGGERSRPTSQPRFRGRKTNKKNKEYVISYVRFVVYSGSLGKESLWLERPYVGALRSRFLCAMETIPKTMAWSASYGKHAETFCILMTYNHTIKGNRILQTESPNDFTFLLPLSMMESSIKSRNLG